ncbi:hypothetical protein CBS147339_1332 [Penicillium roqueforti]|uniref:uncharacterized protein n=1 Tax=Penicillium roqueforti TaxID=5082 RepID=UPI00190B2268|nr:uncharacterized protein LCP9604111_338 [Penicillium roqueforti]KAF9252812.1 hypothetical protein LCP9604111_338 [Penicillium roqueforti]KAI1830680.1 hypothetical protein CBS147337_8528 [Penicillium roqueforti]KAI2679226.1 hypothetical protein LCP963914a_7325 [Penicillium roqueforti]KAI2697925.1 hypothetical protein CBS147372_7497 [Penicillium roqueforti]KAI2721086.1 hypothetical protein CBS147354_5768 [Penicillium roqueforti]
MSKDSVEFIRKLVACPELTESDIDVALTAAGVDELLPDGNRKLSQLGLAATGFLIDSSIAFITLSRDFTSKLKSRVNGIQHRADIAKRTGIDKHLKFDCRTGARSSGVLAIATSALIGAIYLRKKCFMSVAKGLYSLGVLDEHLDQLNLMEIFKDEQRNPLLLPSLVESDSAQTSEIWSQDIPPWPDFPTTPDLGGLSNYERLYNENGLLKDILPDGLSFTDSRSQSPLADDPGQRALERQVLGICHPIAYQEMHHGRPHEVEIPPEQAEQHALPRRMYDHLSISVDLYQPDGFSGQPANQRSSSQHFPRKRENASGMEVQKRKSRCVDIEFRSSLCREAELTRALGLPPPGDTYFRPKIEDKILSLGSEIFSSLSTFLILVGGSQSLVTLRAALKYTRELGDQGPIVQRRRWVSRELTIHERFEIIGEIQDNAAFLQILRCNHILHFYRCTCSPVERTSKFIELASKDELIGQPRARGNPRKMEVAKVVNEMMRDVFPDLEPNSAVYKSKRRKMLGFRKFGQRLHILADCFGDAVLSILHFDRSGDVAGPVIIEKIILAPSDEAFETFVKVLEESQGSLLREISKAAEQAFNHILYEDMKRQNLFALETLAPEEILKFPKGSQELRNLLQ